MKIETKPRTLVMIGVLIAFLIAGYFYMKKTATERTYKAELCKLRIIEEHQRLEIEVMKQRVTLNAMKKAIDDAIPTMRLVPDDSPDDSPEDPNE